MKKCLILYSKLYVEHAQLTNVTKELELILACRTFVSYGPNNVWLRNMSQYGQILHRKRNADALTIVGVGDRTGQLSRLYNQSKLGT